MIENCRYRFKQCMPKIKGFFVEKSDGFFLSRLNQTKYKDNKEYRKFHVKSIYTKIKERNEKIKNGICPKCGEIIVLRDCTYKSCINYPKCKFIIK